jgi:hypothetical protein
MSSPLLAVSYQPSASSKTHPKKEMSFRAALAVRTYCSLAPPALLEKHSSLSFRNDALFVVFADS